MMPQKSEKKKLKLARTRRVAVQVDDLLVAHPHLLLCRPRLRRVQLLRSIHRRNPHESDKSN